jgi:glyoxylase-like metal-dependent hydrolase (beta-lactamase superfamily II)
MGEPAYQPLGYGITCIDAAYVQHGLACFYLVEEGGECAVIETGTCHSVVHLQMVLDHRGIDPGQVRYVIPTHVHLDHAGGAGAMMRLFPEARLLVHPRGARHMIDPARLVEGATAVYGDTLFRELYGEIRGVDASRVWEIGDGESVSLAGRRLVFRHTRGHAEHHFCIWDETSGGWFSGDMFGVSYPWCRFTLGDFVLPSTTPSQFDPQAFIGSLQLLDSYSPQRIYLTHYGELPYAVEKAGLLREQIEAYCELTEVHGEDLPQLQEQLTRLSIALLRRLDEGGDESEWRAALDFDMKLNAQGLQVWLARGKDDSGS